MLLLAMTLNAYGAQEALLQDYKSAAQVAHDNQIVHAEQQKITSATFERVFWHIFIAAPTALSLSITFVGYCLTQKEVFRLRISSLGIPWLLLVATMFLVVLHNLARSQHNLYQTHYIRLITKINELEKKQALLQKSPGPKYDRTSQELITDLSPYEKRELIKMQGAVKTGKQARNLLGYIAPILGDLAVACFMLGITLLVLFVFLSLKDIVN